MKFLRHLFTVMGMHRTGGLRVLVSPAFRCIRRPSDPIKDEALRRNPFRVFTSLFRLDLIEDIELRREAAAILARRNILTQRCRELLGVFDTKGGT